MDGISLAGRTAAKTQFKHIHDEAASAQEDLALKPKHQRDVAVTEHTKQISQEELNGNEEDKARQEDNSKYFEDEEQSGQGSEVNSMSKDAMLGQDKSPEEEEAIKHNIKIVKSLDENRLDVDRLDFEEEYSASNSKNNYEQWLEKKSKAKKILSPAMSAPAMNQSEKRKEEGEQAFKKWLQSKRQRASSVCFTKSNTREMRRQENMPSRTGISYDNWMQQKRREKPRSTSLPENLTHAVVKRVYSSGVTHKEWKESKKKQVTSELMQQYAEHEKQKRATGITFDSWMSEKTKQRQIDEVQQATSLLRKEFEKYMDYQNKLLNPKIKTFEQWQLDKKYEIRLEKANTKRERIHSEKKNLKFEADSKLVFDMWLLNKHLYEMQEEEEQLNDAREQWERKKKALFRTKTK